MIPNLIGNIANWKEIKKIANKFPEPMLARVRSNLPYPRRRNSAKKCDDCKKCTSRSPNDI